MEFKTERTHFLNDAPQCPYSSTEVRDRLERGDDVAKMIDKEVLQYIKQQGLWTLSRKIATLTAALSQEERGKCYYRQNNWGYAINDFRKAEELKPELEEARQFREMVEEILEFRYKDIYNP